MDIESSIRTPAFPVGQTDEVSLGFTIELVEGYGEWFVHTVRKDKTIALRRFDSECFAFRHAESERARLGLGSVSRV